MPGTVFANEDFDADAAAGKLRDAMKGLGTTETDIIEVLDSHNNEQRQEIATAFKQSYGLDLIDELKSELRSDFENTVIALMTPPRLYDARELNRAIKGAGTDETALIEIMCSRTNEELEEIKAVYQTEFETSLEEDLDCDTSGYFGRLMISLVTGGRDTDDDVDEEAAEADAQELYEAGPNSWGTDESKFNQVLCRRNFNQLKRIFEVYAEKYEQTVREAVESEISGDTQSGYLALVDIAEDKPLFFAKRLDNAMRGIGTSDDDLIRLIVSRSEVDMQEIYTKYYFMQPEDDRRTLREAVDSECGGDYKAMLLTLLNPID
ncbi:annexin A13-like [Mizuhopecten yessoensis]|uniref:Annexin n=1 Tax=Mizuhopecten yessoensis TaxID=6573 RepID=A0A210PEL1_MIZYE|nr:annexin A13-like [Mizuhopecten yessoensis]OWF34932.1 Annexin A4 [Mizuhopecten yessoensis]